MPALLVCSACQTKLKVPENSSAKALRCPKCKGVVPIPQTKEKTDPEQMNPAVAEKSAKSELPKSASPPPDEEEFEVNEAADEDEELEVNKAADEDDGEDEEESEDKPIDEDSPLAELGFAKIDDPYKKANIAEDARKTLEVGFVKKEIALWAGRPSVKLIESKAWIGLVVGPILVLAGIGICLLTSGIAFFATTEIAAKIIAPAIGAVFCLVFSAFGILVLIFRKRIGGNVKACYLVTNKNAYIYDGSTQTVRKFVPRQLVKMTCAESSSYPGAGDLIFTYDLHGTTDVAVSKHMKDKYGGTPVGFLNIEQVHLVRKMIQEVLIEPAMAKEKQQAKKNKKRSRPGWSV